MCDTLQGSYESGQITAKCPRCGNKIDYDAYLISASQRIRCSCGSRTLPDLYIDGKIAKKCTGKCKEIKAVSEFNNEKGGKYGVKGKCKICLGKQKKARRQSPEGRSVRKAYNQILEVKEKDKARRQIPAVKISKSEYNKEYKQRPEVKKREAEKREANRRKGSGNFDEINLPELSWDKETRCPWHKDGKLFVIEQSQKDGYTYIVYVFVIRDGKGIIPDGSMYAGFTNIVTDEWKLYAGSSSNPIFIEYLKNNKNLIERHVIAQTKTELEASRIEQDILDHDDGTGIPRWKPERSDWLNLFCGRVMTGFSTIDPNDITDDIVKRFESRINKNGRQTEYVDTCCWEWIGYLNALGYGCFHIKLPGKKVKGLRASRASKIILDKHLFVEGEQANHLCHNPSCVRPDHIYIGTHAENMRDLSESGRKVVLKGEDNPNATIDWYFVDFLRKEFATGNYTQAEMCRRYGMAQGWLGAILRNEMWVE